jgi:hypothetical protein
MLHKHLILIFIAAFGALWSWPAAAQNAKGKVDVESLGLDDVSNTAVTNNAAAKGAAAKVATEENLPEIVLPGESSSKNEIPKENPIVPNAATSTNSVKQPEVEAQSLAADKDPNADSPLKKMQNFLNKENITKNSVDKKIEDKKTTAKTAKYINSTKKKNLKKRLEEEERKKHNEKLREEKLKKLNELREKYLIKAKVKPEDQADEDILDDEDEKIVPHKKEINRFISEEMPAYPILNRYRTSDNLHIPIIPTTKEKIDLLFDSIAFGTIGYFNAAYKNVQNPNARNQNGDTLLTYAIIMQKYFVVASLLAKGADPNMPNALKYTPLDIAIEMLDFKSIELLVKNKADVNYLDNFGRTYLMHAARVGFLPAVELLVERGVDINAMDDDGFTALSIAYRHKKEIIVKFLLKNGAKTWIEKPYEPQKQSLIKELENRWK